MQNTSVSMRQLNLIKDGVPITLDLDDNTKITLQLKSFFLTTIDKLESNRSWTISLPKSDANMATFEFLSKAGSLSRVPYKRYKCEYIVDGVSIFGLGDLRVTHVGKTIDVSIVFTTGYQPLIDKKDALLSDVPLGITQLYDQYTQPTGWLSGGGSYGFFKGFKFTNQEGADINTMFLPTFSANYLLEKVARYFDPQGYFTASGPLRQELQKIALPMLGAGFATSLPAGAFQNRYRYQLASIGSSNMDDFGYTKMVNGLPVSDHRRAVSFGWMNYLASRSDVIFGTHANATKISFEVSLTAPFYNTLPYNADIFIRLQGDEKKTYIIDTLAANETKTITQTIYVADQPVDLGLPIFWSIVTRTKDNSGQFIRSDVRISPSLSNPPMIADFTIVMSDNIVGTVRNLPAQPKVLSIDACLPKIKITDFLVEIQRLTGGYFQFKYDQAGRLYMELVASYFATTYPPDDWSGRWIRGGYDVDEATDVDFTIGNIAQRNTLAYANDVNPTAALVVDNPNLPLTNEFVKTKWNRGEVTWPSTLIDAECIEMYKLEGDTLVDGLPAPVPNYEVPLYKRRNELLYAAFERDPDTGVDYITTPKTFEEISKSYEYRAMESLLQDTHIYTEKFKLEAYEMAQVDIGIPIIVTQLGGRFIILELQWDESMIATAKLLKVNDFNG